MSTGTSCSSNCRIFSTVNPPETTIRTCSNPSPSSARRTFQTSCGLTPPGLNQAVVGPGREEHHLLWPRRFHDAAGVGPDLGAAGENTQVEGLEVGERIVRALDEEHGLPRRDLVAVVQRIHLELRPLHAT